jgi:hypothetical protein
MTLIKADLKQKAQWCFSVHSTQTVEELPRKMSTRKFLLSSSKPPFFGVAIDRAVVLVKIWRSTGKSCEILRRPRFLG